MYSDECNDDEFFAAKAEYEASAAALAALEADLQTAKNRVANLELALSLTSN